MTKRRSIGWILTAGMISGCAVLLAYDASDLAELAWRAVGTADQIAAQCAAAAPFAERARDAAECSTAQAQLAAQAVDATQAAAGRGAAAEAVVTEVTDSIDTASPFVDSAYRKVRDGEAVEGSIDDLKRALAIAQADSLAASLIPWPVGIIPQAIAEAAVKSAEIALENALREAESNTWQAVRAADDAADRARQVATRAADGAALMARIAEEAEAKARDAVGTPAYQDLLDEATKRRADADAAAEAASAADAAATTAREKADLAKSIMDRRDAAIPPDSDDPIQREFLMDIADSAGAIAEPNDREDALRAAREAADFADAAVGHAEVVVARAADSSSAYTLANNRANEAARKAAECSDAAWDAAVLAGEACNIAVDDRGNNLPSFIGFEQDVSGSQQRSTGGAGGSSGTPPPPACDTPPDC